METSLLLESFMLVGQKIDVLWNFYVSVHLAIAAALFYFRKLTIWQYSIFGVGYLFFTVINWRAKTNEYEFYDAITSEIKLRDLQSTTVNRFFEIYEVTDRIFINNTVHIVSGILLLVLIILELYDQAKK